MAKLERMGTVEIDAMELGDKFNVYVNIKNYKRFQVRMWIAIKLMKLAAIVGGLGWGGIEEVTEDG